MSVTVAKFTSQVAHKYQSGVAKEHSYRPAIEELLESIRPEIDAINEPKRQKIGAPDFVILHNKLQIAFLEAKDLHVDLDKEYTTKDQIKRYLALGNLCVTNCLDWIFYRDEVELGRVSIGYLTPDGIEFDDSKFKLLETFIADFLKRQAITINSAKDLASKMASKARLLKEVVFKSLESETPDPDVHDQYIAFKDILIHELSHQSFADIYAQTLAYGFFSARFYDPTLPTFDRDEARRLLPRSNPFLRSFFDSVAGIDAQSEVLWIIDDLVQLFMRVDVATILHGFGKATEQTDAIIHFYESFLGEYDSNLRKSKGVYYTPQPVVDFIVRGVDEILKTVFGIAEGLKDTTKTRLPVTIQQAKERGIPDSELIQTGGQKYIERHRVQILDPATGTGTFPLTIIKHIYEQFSGIEGMWQQYVKDHLIPRLHGFELMMSSYSMAHLQLAMFLKETGVELTDRERLKIYLTNSLEEAHENTHSLFASFLSRESQEASIIKTQTPIMVVIGNPPYAVSSSNKSEWITNLTSDYKKNLNERNIQPLSDDYIKFIRYAEHYIEKNGEGVMAYISNNSFLDGIIHRQMRHKLLQTFDKIYIVDLHGSTKKKETSPDGSKDENVFDIQQGVAIYFFIKTKNKSTKDTDVFHIDVYGKRNTKYQLLNESSISSLQWNQLTPDPKYHFFVPKDFSLQSEYELGINVSDIFNKYSMGIATGDDDKFVSFDENILLANYDQVQKFAYRTFDMRYVVYDNNLLQRARFSLSNNLLNPNLSLIFTKQSKNTSSHTLVTEELVCRDLVTNHSSFAPLYLYQSEKPIPNLNHEIIALIENKLSMKLDWEADIDTSYGETAGEVFSPVDLLDYLYAVLHSPIYRERYKEFLKIDFPSISFDVSNQEFWRLVSIGSELRTLHLMEDIDLTKLTVTYPMAGSNEIDNVKRVDSRVYINTTQYFDNVSDIAWDFYIGGYQPARKWLKDRKGRTLDINDITHYRKIIHILNKTSKLIQKIDK
jgi:predicted helicase